MIAQHMTTTEKTTEDERLWRAVVGRDASATFVYGVRSTGIYCRPACPSRKPHPEGVVYFPVPHDAESAGFRACKRCRPGEADPQVELVEAACRAIEEHLESGMTLAALGRLIGSSPYHLQRTFKRIMGVSPRQYADACRIERFKRAVRERGSVTEALYDAGYGSSSRLYERAAAELGMVPLAYRRGGQGMTIRYAIVDCPLGRLMVAATERGVCFVSLDRDESLLERALHSEYPRASIERDDSGLGTWVEIIVRYLEGRAPNLDLPLDVQATAFQRRVWEEISAIPYGETRTYTEIARSLGQPRAIRAVAHACATNPTSLVVPCHRVVRTDGSLAGYRWGIERKRKLLALEAATSQTAGEPRSTQGRDEQR